MLARPVASTGAWPDFAWSQTARRFGRPRSGAPDGDRAPDDAALSLVTYVCANRATIRATYPTAGIALVQYRGNSREMQAARSASGAR